MVLQVNWRKLYGYVFCTTQVVQIYLNLHLGGLVFTTGSVKDMCINTKGY